MDRVSTGAKGRKSAILGGAALMAGLLGSSGAWAQCTDNFNVAFFKNGVPEAAQNALPLGKGASVPAFLATINTINTAFLTQTTAFVSAPGNPQPDQQGGGAWGRVIAGTVDTDTSSVGTLDLTNYTGGAIAVTGRQTCNATARQDYWGYQVGHDVSILNGGATGANWHFGVTAGYMEGKTKDITAGRTYTNPNFPGVTFNSPAGDFSADSQVPFAGIYTAFTKGGFFLDGQVRVDFFQNSLSDANNGLFGQQLDARGLSLTGNAGYNIPLGSGWFIEPSGGVVWSRVEVDALNVPGFPLAGGRFATGTVTIQDIESILGRASLRVGTNFTTGGLAWQPFFTASVFHEFGDDVVARSLTAGNNDPGCIPGVNCTVVLDGVAMTTVTSRIGTYGQFALGSAAAILNTGWLGYARVDYRVGEDVEGWSVNAGLRYQFTPEARGSVKDGFAAAADYNWTGFYLGANTGRTEGDQHWRILGTTTGIDPEFGGYVLGGQFGYNVQFAKNAVVGIEADYGYTNAEGGVSCPNAFFFTCEARADTLGSLTGRLGYSWGRALFYAKGGWAFGEVSAGTFFNNPPVQTGDDSKWRNGWTLGGGMEFALTDRWSAKAEYMHYDLGSDTFRVQSITPGGAPSTAPSVDGDITGDIVRVGVNLHFNPIRREERPLK